MTLGALKTRVLSLLDRAFLDGLELPESYNGQADLIRRIPVLAADGLMALASGACPLWEQRRYRKEDCARAGEGLIALSLPDNRMKSLPMRLFGSDGRELCFGLRGEKLIINSSPAEFSLCYGRLPALPEVGSEDSFILDCATELVAPLSFYVAALLAESFDFSLASVFMSRFDALTAGLREAPIAEQGIVFDVFGGDTV